MTLGEIGCSDRVVIAVESSDRFARKISKELNQAWNVDTLLSHFYHPDGDYDPKLVLQGKEGFNDEAGNRLKGKSVYLVASKRNWEPSLLFERINYTAELCHHNGAEKIYLVWTNIRLSGNHLRPNTENRMTASDLKKYDGKLLSSDRIARVFKFSHIDHVMTLHTHSKNMVEAFGEHYLQDTKRGSEVFTDLPVAPLIAHYLYTSEKISETGRDAVFVSTDDGSKELAIDIMKNIQGYDPNLRDISWVQFRKERDPVTGYLKNIYEASTSENYEGHEGKNKFIFDDIVRSFSSMYGVIEKMGGENFTMFATHAHLTGRSQSLLRSHKVKEIIFTNTMTNNLEDPYYEHELFDKTIVLKVGKYFADAILNIIEKGKDPDEYYRAKSPKDIQKIGELYRLRRPV